MYYVLVLMFWGGFGSAPGRWLLDRCKTFKIQSDQNPNSRFLGEVNSAADLFNEAKLPLHLCDASYKNKCSHLSSWKHLEVFNVQKFVFFVNRCLPGSFKAEFITLSQNLNHKTFFFQKADASCGEAGRAAFWLFSFLNPNQPMSRLLCVKHPASNTCKICQSSAFSAGEAFHQQVDN